MSQVHLKRDAADLLGHHLKLEPSVTVIHKRKGLGTAVVRPLSSTPQAVRLFGEKLLFLIPRNKYAAGVVQGDTMPKANEEKAQIIGASQP